MIVNELSTHSAVAGVAHSPNMKVNSGTFFQEQKTNKGVFSYADLTVVCSEPEFHDKFRDALINPIVIIEILSGSSEDFNRNENFRR